MKLSRVHLARCEIEHEALANAVTPGLPLLSELLSQPAKLS